MKRGLVCTKGSKPLILLLKKYASIAKRGMYSYSNRFLTLQYTSVLYTKANSTMMSLRLMLRYTYGRHRTNVVVMSLHVATTLMRV